MINSKLFDWIGGKKWLSKNLSLKFDEILNQNKNIKYYAEPFCGSLGSIMNSIQVFKNSSVEKIYLNDINTTLINTFIFIKEDPELVCEEFSKIEKEYMSYLNPEVFNLKKTKDKIILKELMLDARDYYNKKRELFNKIKDVRSIESSIAFLFLMTHSFNGLYRENSKGEFNAPYNWDNARINIENKKRTIMEWSSFFNDMNIFFTNMNYLDFLESMKDLKGETLFYFDPPYINEKTKENSYNKDFFDKSQQEILIDNIKSLDYFVYSNHDVELINNFFGNNYNVEKVWRKNIISSDVNSRSNDVCEIIVYS